MSKLEIKTEAELKSYAKWTHLRKWASVESHFKLFEESTKGCPNRCDKLVDNDYLLCDDCAEIVGKKIFKQLKEQDDE